MLSDVDLKKVLGKGIVIYPLTVENIEGGSIYLTASDLAWSCGKARHNEEAKIVYNGKIHIPKNDTAIIISKEAIALNNQYAGTCHSRVSLVAKGLDHISTPMKPGTCGRLLLSIHNNTNEDISIGIDEKIAVVMFHQLMSKAKKGSDKNHVSPIVLSQLGIKVDDRDSAELENIIYNDYKEMSYALKSSEEFNTYIKRYQMKVQFIDILIFLVGILFLGQIVLFFNLSVGILSDLIKITIPVTGTFFGVLVGKRIR